MKVDPNLPWHETPGIYVLEVKKIRDADSFEQRDGLVVCKGHGVTLYAAPEFVVQGVCSADNLADALAKMHSPPTDGEG